MTKQRLITPVLLAALLSGCSLIPNYERPAVETPTSWSEMEATASEQTKIAKNWWTNFDSAELNKLMEQALVSNNDIGAAVQRIEQARATLRTTRSSLLPNVNGSGSITNQNIRSPNAAGGDSDDLGYLAGANVAYELDLFGLNRANTESSAATLQGTEYARDALALIIMGDVAKTYFNVLNLQERLSIADQNLDSARELLRIVQARYDAGATTLLDVAQQKSDLATSEANRAAIENQMKIAKTSLAVLVGVPPQNLTVTATDLRPLPVPSIAPGQPSSLLERRPDIRQSEASLLAANADIGAARAAFYPNITLGLGGSIGATPFDDPTTKILSIGADILAPIFSAGRLEGNLERTKARRAELAYNYRQTVLVSFKDVEDALSTIKAATARETSLETAMNEARIAYDLSQQQYDAGAIDFQILLDARRTMLTAEDTYIQTKNDRLAAAVDLFKALGGGWYEGESAPAAAPAPVVTPEPVATTPAPTTTAPAEPAITTPASPATPQPTTPLANPNRI